MGTSRETGQVDSLLQPVRWAGAHLELIDQTELPSVHRVFQCASVGEVAAAIRSMKVRGAPAIGVTAAYGYALAARSVESEDSLASTLGEAYTRLLETRPTAVNLRWALDRMRAVSERLAGSPLGDVKASLVEEAKRVQEESNAADRKLSDFGASLLRGRKRILTHCNAGPLATAGYGTAVGVIRRAFEIDPGVSVLADETRPFLQGSRLTAWELVMLGIPVTIITDSMAGYMMSQGEVDGVVVGADRVAANGDVANKIGTYSLAVLARAHDIPFYVAAPTSTIDLSTPSGREIPIEERDPEEILAFRGTQVAPIGAAARHPAFDITPSHYITAIVTEEGVASGDYDASLRHVMSRAEQHG